MVTESYRQRKGQKRPFESEGAERSQKRRAGGIPMPTSVLEEDENSETPEDGSVGAEHVSVNPFIFNAMNDDAAGDKETDQSGGDGLSERKDRSSTGADRNAGYDPFEVDFNFLFQKLRDENCETFDHQSGYPGQVGDEVDGRPNQMKYFQIFTDRLNRL